MTDSYDSQRQAGALLSQFLSASLALFGRVDTPLALPGKARNFIRCNEEAHEADTGFIERERFAFDLIDGHWS